MKPAIGPILGLIAALAAAGCSETKFADMLGAGKSSPDETQIRTSQSLTLPPDMRLPAPGAVTEDGNLQRNAAAPAVSVAPDTQTASTSQSDDFWASERQPETQVAAAQPADNRTTSQKQSQEFWASEMKPSSAPPGSEQARKETFWGSGTNDLFKSKGKRNPFWDADPNAPTTKPVTKDEALAKFGISKTKPDGTPKTANELDNELKAAVLAEKRKTNPNYGTIWNIGNIFNDE